MYRVPQAGPRQPAVGGPVVQRGVRRRLAATAGLLLTIYLLSYCASRARYSLGAGFHASRRSMDANLDAVLSGLCSPCDAACGSVGSTLNN